MLAIEWLKAASQKAVAEMLGLSWDEIHGIMERAVSVAWSDAKRSPSVRLVSMKRPFEGSKLCNLGE